MVSTKHADPNLSLLVLQEEEHVEEEGWVAVVAYNVSSIIVIFVLFSNTDACRL